MDDSASKKIRLSFIRNWMRRAGHCKFFFAALSVLILPACSAKGPPFPNLPSGEKLPEWMLSRRFIVDAPIKLYRIVQRGELVFHQREKGTDFRLAIVGKNPIESIRVRLYEGTAHLVQGTIELRSDHCTISGKKDWEDRLVPIEGWDCEHLIFALKSSFQPGTLHSTRNDHTSQTEWFGDFTAVPMPVSSFAGQILWQIDPEKVVIWGYNGGRILRDGDPLSDIELDQSGNQVPQGQLTVLSRPGDFIVTRLNARPNITDAAAPGSQKYRIAYTTKPKPGGGSIF